MKATLVPQRLRIKKTDRIDLGSNWPDDDGRHLSDNWGASYPFTGVFVNTSGGILLHITLNTSRRKQSKLIRRISISEFVLGESEPSLFLLTVF